MKNASLVLRLTLSYLAAAAAVLLLASVALEWTLARNLAKVELRLLDQKVDLFIQDQALEPSDYSEVFHQLSVAAPGHDPHEYWVRVVDRTGRTLAESPGMAALLPSSSFAAAPTDQLGRGHRRLHTTDGKVYRLRTAWSALAGLQRRGIEIALDGEQDEALLKEYRGQLALVVLLGLLALGIAGVWIARRGLRPLDDLGRALRAQNAESLAVPLDLGRWPAETRQVIEGYNDLAARLHESFQRLSQFSADLAHELRTPLHNLRLQSDVILSRPRKAADYKLALLNAQDEYARLTRMTESLLFLARAENGSQSVQKVHTDLRAELESAAKLFQAQAKQRGLSLDLSGQASAEVDRGLLQMTLSNLLANAFAHTPKGGKVKLQAAKFADKGTRITVTDSGEGMDPAEIPWVFDRFYRGDPARARAEGSGLGLSIVKAVMDLHRGTVSIQSRKGRGCTVTLELP